MSDQLRAQIASQLATLPERLGGHIFLSVTALIVGVIISVPLGIWASRRPRVEHCSLLIASIVQTIPGLALLALMVFAWSTIGWVPALVALILYSVLPTLRNTITGLQGVDPAIREAALGVGMDRWQLLRIVELPLAAPTIVAGVRTASVWVVGAATIAQPVGATSLGNYIFVGLQTFNMVALLFGCVLSAAFALLLDGMLYSLQRAVLRKDKRLGAYVAIGFVLVIASPLLLEHVVRPGRRVNVTTSDRLHTESIEPYVIGSKAFTEQYILADLIADRLRAQGREARVLDGMGSATVFHALTSGSVDCLVDYSGTIWTNYMQQDRTMSPVETMVEVSTYMMREHGIVCLGSMGFSNDYAFAMRRQHAQSLGIENLVDLARFAPQLTAGTDIEFFDRPEWRDVQNAYGLRFAERTTMDPTLMYGAIAGEQLDVIIAFATDARLEAYALTVLDDPKFSLPPYDAVLLVSKRMARDPAAMKALRPLVQSISTPAMRRANGIVDLDNQPVEAAVEFLKGLKSAGSEFSGSR